MKMNKFFILLTCSSCVINTRDDAENRLKKLKETILSSSDISQKLDDQLDYRLRDINYTPSQELIIETAIMEKEIPFRKNLKRNMTIAMNNMRMSSWEQSRAWEKIQEINNLLDHIVAEHSQIITRYMTSLQYTSYQYQGTKFTINLAHNYLSMNMFGTTTLTLIKISSQEEEDTYIWEKDIEDNKPSLAFKVTIDNDKITLTRPEIYLQNVPSGQPAIAEPLTYDLSTGDGFSANQVVNLHKINTIVIEKCGY